MRLDYSTNAITEIGIVAELTQVVMYSLQSYSNRLTPPYDILLTVMARWQLNRWSNLLHAPRSMPCSPAASPANDSAHSSPPLFFTSKHCAKNCTQLGKSRMDLDHIARRTNKPIVEDDLTKKKTHKKIACMSWCRVKSAARFDDISVISAASESAATQA